jgi:tetratricopeptide (TPR) repeat protein
LEGTQELANELALFNRVGDLYLKIQKVPEAVDMYERAANLYAEYGFPNNAIALCNKVLRNAPGRTHVYLRLAQLMVERGLVAQAKQNLLEYAERMQTAGKTDEAFRALKEFADLSPENEEIRLLLAEQLKSAARTTEAREQLAKLFAESQAKGDERRSRTTLQNIKAIDPDFDPETAPKAKIKTRSKKSADLVFLDLEEEYRTEERPIPGAQRPTPTRTAAPATADLPLVQDTSDLEGAFEVQEAEEGEAPEEPEGLVIETSALEGAGDATAAVTPVEGLDIERTSLAEEEVLEEQAPIAPAFEIERTSLADEEEVEEPVAAAPPLDVPLERASAETPVLDVPEMPDVKPVAARDSVELPDIELEPTASEATLEVPDLDVESLEVPELEEEVPELEEELPELEEVPEAVEQAAVTAAAPAAAYEAPDVPTLEARVADNPDDPPAHVVLGEALIEAGKRERGIEELDIALGLFETAEEWNDVRRLVSEILRLEPNSVRHHQKRVEASFRSDEKRDIVEAYLGLANALLRSGNVERAEMVFKRVLEYDRDNHEARDALVGLVPEEPAAPVPAAAPGPKGGGDYVDLGALIFDEEVTRDTRMRVEDEEPTGDEERDFAEMLSQFKRGIEANIEDEDWQAHYDLGVAFKEMGLLDEAIAEFQKALRAPEGRLRTAEALGGCFFDKGQFSVASTVMRRAVETDPSSDDSKIALLYWMGRCEEEMGRKNDALGLFQRVFALDIRFADVADRVERLAAAGP